MTGGRILVVDDNRMSRRQLQLSLEQQGHSVTLAANGSQALELLRTQSFDTVLLDLVMPEMDGFQVLQIVKSDPILRHIPIIVISALDEMAHVIHCIEMGATDYLLKPFDPVLLQARINASLASKRLHDIEEQHLHQIQEYVSKLQAEQSKSESLLLNILPFPIAERLKQEGGIIVDSFADVGVLFADIVGFTDLSVRMTPKELVALLDQIFSAFDRLADEYQVEKIKTIGDAYMAASGLPVPREGHLESMADLALRMQLAVDELNWRRGEQIQLRIGFHAGPVIAGVIGRRKFIYDLWGDTVNIASRMESHGMAGGIHVAASTYERLKGQFNFRELSLMAIKGKGEMLTYLLTGRRPKSD